MALSGSRCLPVSLVYFPPPWPRRGQRDEGGGGSEGRGTAAAWGGWGGAFNVDQETCRACEEVFHSSKDARMLDFFFFLLF